MHVREIRVYMDREKFILNPTNCDPLSIRTRSTAQARTRPTRLIRYPVTRQHAIPGRGLLEPRVQTKIQASQPAAKPARADGASLTVKLTDPRRARHPGEHQHASKSNSPSSSPRRLTTLQKACTAAKFAANPAGCPAASMIGHAKAITPILPVPLEGPAYFVSHGGEVPRTDVVLQGYGVTIDLHGETFISKAGVTSSTFKTVPDQPVTSFELTLPEGPYSALTALGNLCKGRTDDAHGIHRPERRTDPPDTPRSRSPAARRPRRPRRQSGHTRKTRKAKKKARRGGHTHGRSARRGRR